MVKFNFQPLKRLYFFILCTSKTSSKQEQNHSLIFVLPACLRISFQTQGVEIEFSHLLTRLLWWQICVQQPSLSPLAQHLTRNIPWELSLWPGSPCWTPQFHQGHFFQTFCSKLERIRLKKLCCKSRAKLHLGWISRN